MKEAIETLATFELFKGRDPSQFSIERLGGLTNKNFKVVDGENKYVLRIPGEGTEEYINRKAEEVAARISADLGVNAEVLHFDTSSGVQLTRFIEGAITMNEEGFKQPGTAGRAALALRDVHRSGKKFTSEFNIFSMMDEYLGILRGKNAWVPEGYEKVQEEADSIRQHWQQILWKRFPVIVIPWQKIFSIPARGCMSWIGNMPETTIPCGILEIFRLRQISEPIRTRNYWRLIAMGIHPVKT